MHGIDHYFCTVVDANSRVLFPADWNCAVAAQQTVYATRGQIWTLVVPKRELPVWFSPDQAQQLVHDGAVIVRPTDTQEQRLQLVATGGYQLAEALKASTRLRSVGIDHSVVYLQEPGRFPAARDAREALHVTPPERVDALFPPSAAAPWTNRGCCSPTNVRGRMRYRRLPWRWGNLRTDCSKTGSTRR